MKLKLYLCIHYAVQFFEGSALICIDLILTKLFFVSDYPSGNFTNRSSNGKGVITTKSTNTATVGSESVRSPEASRLRLSGAAPRPHQPISGA